MIPFRRTLVWFRPRIPVSAEKCTVLPAARWRFPMVSVLVVPALSSRLAVMVLAPRSAFTVLKVAEESTEPPGVSASVPPDRLIAAPAGIRVGFKLPDGFRPLWSMSSVE